MMNPTLVRAYGASIIGLRLATANRARFIGSVFGVAVAAALIQYQTSLIYGFLQAGRAPIAAIGADIWIVPKHQPAFDFSSPLSAAYESMAHSADVVARTIPVINGFASLKSTDGRLTTVTVVGTAIDEIDADLRQQGLQRFVGGTWPVGGADAIDGATLSAGARAADVEINGQHTRLLLGLRGYSTFLGSPYVFTDLRHARSVLGTQEGYVSSVALRLRDHVSGPVVAAELRTRFPEVTVLEADDFAADSSSFWLLRTGAGGGLALSAALGFVVGLIIISQTLHNLAEENRSELATLRAAGFTLGDLLVQLCAQALLLAGSGAVVGLLAGSAMVGATQAWVVGWIQTPAWAPFVVLIACVLMAIAGGAGCVVRLVRINPASAFRTA